jgi:hypothetical protein
LEGSAAEVRRICSDSSRPVEQRLEAYEDVYESRVGNTIVSRARNIERDVGLRQIYLRFEGHIALPRASCTGCSPVAESVKSGSGRLVAPARRLVRAERPSAFDSPAHDGRGARCDYNSDAIMRSSSRRPGKVSSS